MRIKTVYSNTYFIQEGGLISSPVLGEGRMIPALVVDSNKDNGLKELLKIHEDSPPGDVIVQWAYPFSQFFTKKVWHLDIEFSQPLQFQFQIEFELMNDYSLIDAIHQARGLYITQGKKGEKISLKQDQMILVEVPDTNTDSLWNKILEETLRKKFRKNGVPKKQLKKEVLEHLKKMREILNIRRPS